MYTFSFIGFSRRNKSFIIDYIFLAEVAELVDALASEASGGNPVEVQVLSSAYCKIILDLDSCLFYANKSSRIIWSALSGPVEIRIIFLDKIDSIA